MATLGKWLQLKKLSLYSSPYYGKTKYSGEKRMTDILKHLNTIIDNAYEFLDLYQGSELENQHKDKDYASEIEDFALKLEGTRSYLFGDSLNFNRIVELAENQMNEVQQLENEIVEEIENRKKSYEQNKSY